MISFQSVHTLSNLSPKVAISKICYLDFVSKVLKIVCNMFLNLPNRNFLIYVDML